MSAIESNSRPKGLSKPPILATLPSSKSKKQIKELDALLLKTKKDMHINHFEDNSNDGNIFEKAIMEESERQSTAYYNEPNVSPSINFMDD